MPLTGRVVTGDALYCQRDLCAQIVAAGGGYSLVVKANQPALLDDLITVFADVPLDTTLAVAEQRDRHADRQEVRRLTATDALTDYLAWPGLAQVWRLERTVTRQGRTTRQVRHGITSMTADAGTLLRTVRRHWAIENRLHWVRDVTLGEDGNQTRSGQAPQVLAALRNAVLGLLRAAGTPNIAAKLRELGWQPGAAVAFLGITVPEN